jgi:predicted type IV restriction endonuclease
MEAGGEFADKIQFLKFQAFADTLTKETQDLKVKIEGHKRENRRLATLLDQQKDDSARLSVRLGGTEKQRDDALEALVLQQEIAEELERERKRNRKELNALQHTNVTIVRQRDEARRVVLHLRSLISGQHHHMEHLVKTLTSPDELAAEIEAGFAAQEEVEAAAIAERRTLYPRGTECECG